jgi:hypothetical protein
MIGNLWMSSAAIPKRCAAHPQIFHARLLLTASGQVSIYASMPVLKNVRTGMKLLQQLLAVVGGLNMV